MYAGLNAGQFICFYHNNTHSEIVSFATDMLLVVTRYNTVRDECDMSTEQDGWHANWKQGKVADSVTFLLHSLNMRF